MSVIAKGPQGKPGLTFWASFHFFVSYFDPLSLWQKPRLVALIWKFHRKMTRSFFGTFPASWAQSPASQACLLSFFLVSTELSQLVEPSSELGPLHQLVSLVWIGLWGLKYPIWWPAVFRHFLRSKWPSARKLSKAFGKALSLVVLVCWAHMKLLSLFLIIFVCFVSYFHCSVEILRVKMSLLTEGSRESLSSLFDLVFCSWALIWCQ